METGQIKVIQGDITRLNVDAIVNAANSRLLGGGGVDGAIHRAAGPELLEACRKIGGCPTGEARLTPGFRLPAAHVIHTVGPVWNGGRYGEPQLLASCYTQSLNIARDNNFSSVAFPNISTGIYGYPKQEAAEIAISTVKNYLKDHNFSAEITFVCFDQENYAIYQALLDKAG